MLPNTGYHEKRAGAPAMLAQEVGTDREIDNLFEHSAGDPVLDDMKKLLAVLALSAIAAFGADATGKWSGAFTMTTDGETKDDTIFLSLKQTGGEISGTAGPNVDKQFPIKSGKIEGNKIVLNVQTENTMITLTLAIDGDHLTGDAKGEDGDRKMSAKIDAKRES